MIVVGATATYELDALDAGGKVSVTVDVSFSYHINYLVAFSLAVYIYELFHWLYACYVRITIFSAFHVYSSSAFGLAVYSRCLYDCTLCIAMMIVTLWICMPPYGPDAYAVQCLRVGCQLWGIISVCRCHRCCDSCTAYCA